MEYTAPGSPELRALVAPFIETKAYPQPRVLTDGDVNRMSPCTKRDLARFRTLIETEIDMARRATSDVPKQGSPWALLREDMRQLLEKILVSSPNLIEIETVQLHAIEKGAIPDPDAEESGMKYYRLPDWNFACWTCGTPIASATVAHSVHVTGMRGAGTGEVRNEHVPYCPHCEKKPSLHGAPVYV